MKIHIPNYTKTSIGGGWTFLRNLTKGLGNEIEIVDNWKDCDIYFVFGITTIDKGELYEALKTKKFVLRVDNIPRKSRNKRQSPVDRLAEFGKLASAVVYQGEWCKRYAGFFIENDNEVIINNGVDTDIFNTLNRHSDNKTYLYIDYNDNPNKRFDEALYWFDMAWRRDNKKHLIIAGNAPKIYLEHSEYNWDLPVPAKVEYAGILNTPEEVASVMKQCDYILYPAFCDAYPNTLLEAIACGCTPLALNKEGGSIEVAQNGVKTIQEMSKEYLELFNRLLDD